MKPAIFYRFNPKFQKIICCPYNTLMVVLKLTIKLSGVAKRPFRWRVSFFLNFHRPVKFYQTHQTWTYSFRSTVSENVVAIIIFFILFSRNVFRNYRKQNLSHAWSFCQFHFFRHYQMQNFLSFPELGPHGKSFLDKAMFRGNHFKRYYYLKSFTRERGFLLAYLKLIHVGFNQCAYRPLCNIFWSNIAVNSFLIYYRLNVNYYVISNWIYWHVFPLVTPFNHVLYECRN